MKQLTDINMDSDLRQFVGEILLESDKITLKDLEEAIEEQKHTQELLGQIFVRKGLMGENELLHFLEKQLNTRLEASADPHKRIGEILLNGKAITRWQLSQALSEQGQKRKKVGQILIEKGYATRGHVEQALSHQCIGDCPQTPKERKSLGTLLLQSHRLTPVQLQEALDEQKHTHEYLGDLLIRKAWITEEELEDVLVVQLLEGKSDDKHLRLGEILVETHQISPKQLQTAIQLQAAMAAQKKSERKIGDILVEWGLLPFKELKRALRLQKKLISLSLKTALGAALIVSCATPTVPMQYPMLTNPTTNLSIASNQGGAYNPFGGVPRALRGPYKSLSLPNGKVLNVYQNGSKVLENVPFFIQGNDNTCGQAVMSSLVNYWGLNMQYQEVVNEANPRNAPTTDDALTNYFRSKGLHAQEYSGGTIQNLISQVNQGRPTIVLLDFGGISQEHYVIVVGYNQKNGTFIIHDSLEGPYIEMSMQNLDRMWQNKSIRMVHIFGGDNYFKLMVDVYRK